MKYEVTTFYNFHELAEDEVAERKRYLEEVALGLDVCGLIILAPEGLNATVAASQGKIEQFKELIRGLPGCDSITFKDSTAETKPFRRFKVKIRDEIVTLGRPDIVPSGSFNHLSPEQWHRVLTEEEDFVLIDTRNWYETDVGKFKGALDPRMEMFTEFADFVKQSKIPKDKKVLMYCTGGIRCEKASLEMAEQGYEQVYQLDGGILKYLEEYPDGEYEGECFVFDHRVAVDTSLQPSSRFGLCPHCGNPGDQKIECPYCQKEGILCQHCIDTAYTTCSKNCQHHYDRGTRRSHTAKS